MSYYAFEEMERKKKVTLCSRLAGTLSALNKISPEDHLLLAIFTSCNLSDAKRELAKRIQVGDE